MTVSVTPAYTGTITIGATEWSLPNNVALASSTPIVTGIWAVLMLDLSALAAGDWFALRHYTKIISGGTLRQVGLSRYFRSAQGNAFASIQLVCPSFGWDISMIKLSGTDRAIPFSIFTA